MDFGGFINECWRDHDKETEAVATKLKEAVGEVNSAERLASYAMISFHTIAGHLGRFEEAFELLKGFEGKDEVLSGDGAKRMLGRMLGSCSVGLGQDAESYLKTARDGEAFPHSADVRVYATAAANLAAAGRLEEAIAAFEKARGAMPESVEKDDPSAKSLAITSNNLACDLEEKEDRSEEETSLMVQAAQMARTYWELAGTWVEVERAEYRLSQTYLKANQLDKALEHALLCQKICQENDANPFETFFAHEALVKVHRAHCVALKGKVKEDLQQYCELP